MELPAQAPAARAARTPTERAAIVVEAVAAMGGCTEAAKRLSEWSKARGSEKKIGKTGVSNWTNEIPGKWVRGVHELTGIALRRLRPDLYDPRAPAA